MSQESVLETVSRLGVVPVVAIDSVDAALPLADALLASRDYVARVKEFEGGERYYSINCTLNHQNRIQSLSIRFWYCVNQPARGRRVTIRIDRVRKPSINRAIGGAVQAWMAPYVLLVFPKDATEQGEWAALAALQIANGVSPSEIPMVQNERFNPLINNVLADRLQLDIPPELIAGASNAVAK